MHLHDLKNLLDTAEVKIDYCAECKKKFVYRKDRFGRIDNQKYLKDHRRQYLQSTDPLYKKYYKQAPNYNNSHKIVEEEFKKYQALKSNK